MITQAKAGVHCNYCQDAWGGARINGVWTWHPKATTQAVVTITSQRFKNTRSYCDSCRTEISQWPKNAKGDLSYPLFAQVMDANNE